jgi:hypothetical protein
LVTPYFLIRKRLGSAYLLDLRRLIREVTTRFELVMRVLQTLALPLGYVTVKL